MVTLIILIEGIHYIACTVFLSGYFIRGGKKEYSKKFFWGGRGQDFKHPKGAPREV